VLEKRIQATAYHWHNYGKPTIGNRSDIERVPIETLKAFYQKYYQPDNVVLILAGKFDENKALELIGKYFGTLARPERKLPATYTEEPPQDGERAVVLRRVGDVGEIALAYHIPAGSHEDWASLEVLANVLASQPSGRLYKALVESRKVSSLSADAGSEHDPGLLTVNTEVPRDVSIEEVRDQLINLVEASGQDGFTDEEVSRAKSQILKAREQAASDTSRLGLALSEWVAQGDWRLYFLHRDRVEKVDAGAVKAAALKYLRRNNRTVGLFIPSEKSERIAIPAAPDLVSLLADYRGRAVVARGEAFDATPANIEARTKRFDLPEGIKATYFPKKTRGEEVRLTLNLRYGNAQNLKGLEVAGAFLPELLARGTKKHSYQQLQDELDRLHATLTAGSGGGACGCGLSADAGCCTSFSPAPLGVASFQIQAKRETLPEVLKLLREVLREPLLPEDQFELLRRAGLANLEESRTEPSSLASESLRRQLTPLPQDDVRYTPTSEESIARYKAVTYAQVVELYRDYLGSQAGELTLVGDFDEQAVTPILTAALSGWKAGKPYERIPVAPAAAASGGEQRISTPDKANAIYLAGFLFPVQDTDPDYPALLIGNRIFGGGALSSRLGDRVRQKEGLSYSISSSLSASAFEQQGELRIGAIANPANIDRVRTAVKEELERLLRDGVTPEELEKARQGYLLSQKVARSSDPGLLGGLATLRYEGRTFAFQSDLEAKISALTADQIAAAWRARIDPGKLFEVTAGDFGEKIANSAL